MKKIQLKTYITTIVFIMLFATSCSDVLEEKPRATFTPEYFKTEKGVNGGLTSLYYNLRNLYGQPYYYNSLITGTDEATWAQSADGNFKDMDLSGVGSIIPTSYPTGVLWGTVWPNINTASGIIENGAAVGVANSLIAEARFFRAFDYFLLVQTYGGVPLDLGSGELKFNITPSFTSVRNTVPEVYTKAVFPDLKAAVNDLPATGRLTGALTKTAARLYLSKAYLTYAWWLQNPNNIPTYPETTRVDPDGHDAAWYFQQAYNIALEGISDPGTYKLQSTYYDVNLGSNDRNSEIILYADHTEKSELFNASSLTYASGPADNYSGWMMTWNYTELRSSGKSSVQREAEQHLGRPWTRMCPTIGVIENTFADKTNDSRYDGTFVTTYRANWPKGGLTDASLINANGMSIVPGDAVLTFLNNEPSTAITYPAPGNGGDSNIGAGTLPGRADYVISPRGVSRKAYPGLWKLGPYRTDNGTTLGSPNAASTRPFNIAKFSEFYFIAAEAAVKGATTQSGKSARELINVIRARAGKWRFDNNGNVAKVVDNSAAMTAATPVTIDINYILAERSREYYGEGYRWFDLVRTQKWAELASSYQIGGANKGDHTPITVNRTISNYMYLRPIPKNQLDKMNMTADEKLKYQNPVYSGL